MLQPLNLTLYGDESPPAASDTCRQQAHRYLAAIEPLYAVVDAACSENVAPLLEASGARHQSLFSGDEGARLAPWGPFLVEVTNQPLLAQLVQHGWGESWGVYLTCPRPFKALRRHLMRQLHIEQNGAPAVYRFYDPRVLRQELAEASPAHTEMLFGPISHWFVEDADPQQLLVHSRVDGGAVGRTVVTL